MSFGVSGLEDQLNRVLDKNDSHIKRLESRLSFILPEKLLEVKLSKMAQCDLVNYGS